MRKMVITTESAINEHFNEVSKLADLAMNKETAKADYEKQRQDFLNAFRKSGEIKVEVVGMQWTLCN